MQRKKYHVTYRPDGKWQGELEKTKRASVVEETKDEAVKKTVEIAKNAGNSQVFIHGKDGKIQDERTYGNDPRNIPG